MTRLSVNVNKVATVRNARGGNNPDLVQVVKDCESFGAQGITVHPRPDERHITKKDVYDLKEVVQTELNIEGYPDNRFLTIVRDVRPIQATLVPDGPDVLTSNAGWNTLKNKALLSKVIEELHSYNCRVSIFVDASEEMISGALDMGADRVELYTEPYAARYAHDRNEAVRDYVKAAEFAKKLGLGINAGHDLSLENLRFLKEKIPFLDEVSIGHALICDALYFGLENTVQLYLNQLQ